ncbi:hypothetical protein MA16_Dca019750 [Dendrobium catenatum]|uniref:Uncharacterized protein n=1 Tax=Dendrobium catenatum TaxID=906689 RepID=A0A2I0VQT2_9ASPA|nr:hypothetical protein MA16_Dca019750 [Dendrobium catenatum]
MSKVYCKPILLSYTTKRSFLLSKDLPDVAIAVQIFWRLFGCCMSRTIPGAELLSRPSLLLSTVSIAVVQPSWRPPMASLMSKQSPIAILKAP